MRRLVATAVLVLAAACSKQPAAPATTPSTASTVDIALDPTKQVAVIGGERITGADLDAKISSELGEARTEFVESVHKLRRAALEQLVADKLMEMEAKARGVDKQALIAAEVENKVPPPTEEALQKFFDEKVAPQMPGAKLDDLRDRLVGAVNGDAMRTRYKTFLDELKAKYKAEVSLPMPNLPRVEVAATGPASGPADAKITMVEFSDFQCPYCSRAAATVKELEKAYAGKLRLVFRNYPLPFHSDAPKAAEAGACAADQGKFWEMHDAMFTHQSDKLSVEGLKELARGIAGLDAVKFDGCLDGGSKKAVVDADMADAQKAGVRGTPAFFINGRSLSGALPIEQFKEVIDAELAGK